MIFKRNNISEQLQKLKSRKSTYHQENYNFYYRSRRLERMAFNEQFNDPALGNQTDQFYHDNMTIDCRSRNNNFMENNTVDSLTIVKNHYNAFKPALNSIKNFKLKKLKSAVIGKALTDIKHEETREFVVSDLSTLFTESNRERFQYYNKLEPNLHEIENISEYAGVINTLGDYSQQLHAESTFFRSSENELMLKDIFLKNRPYGDYFSLHEDFDRTAMLLSERFSEISSANLKMLMTFIEHHEALGLATMEPYVLVIAGHQIFYNILVPLHAKGCFTKLINTAVNKQLSTRILYHDLYKRVNTSIDSFNSMPYRQKAKFTFIGIGACLGSVTACHLAHNQFRHTSLTTVKDFTVEYFKQRSGFENSYIVYAKVFLNKVAHDIGAVVGGITANFVSGLLKQHEEIVVAVAENVDKIINKKTK